MGPADLAFFTLYRGATNDIDGPGKIHRADIIPRVRQPMVNGEFGSEQSEQPRKVHSFSIGAGR